MHRSVVDVNPALTQRVGWRSNSAQRDNDEEMKMRLLGKTAIVLGMAGAMALGSMTASEARNGRNAAIAVGAGAFVAGAAIGAAAANANAGYYYGSGYGYDSYAYEPTYVAPAYDSYAYEPTYVAPAYTAPSYYGPVRTYGYSGYNTNYTGPWSERRLMGLD
jgi:hypothetical protein